MHPLLDRAGRAIDAATRGASPRALEERDNDRWSPANIVEHLLLTYRGTTYALRRCLEQERTIGHRPSLLRRLRRTTLLYCGRFPRVEAPDRTRPVGMPIEEALASFHVELARMDEALAACEARFGARAWLADHPFLGGLRAADYRRFHWQHARHHARQIRSRVAS